MSFFLDLMVVNLKSQNNIIQCINDYFDLMVLLFMIILLIECINFLKNFKN